MINYNVDIHEDPEHLYVEAELPGLSKDDIEITLEEGILAIRGEKKFERQEKEQNYHVHERCSGKFFRRFQLPTRVNEDHVNATLRDGVLKITLDKHEEVKPKRIEVKVN